nr:DUF2726 domain-containing protein [uncultured Oscillibacter sp.]
MYIETIIIILLICYIIYKRKQNNREIETNETEIPINIERAYQKKWILTYNEKDAYRKIKEITDKLGYTLFTKVRLFDLIEPVRGNPKYKTNLYKIQAKHVDFVICDEKLVARYVIELDDNSHNSEKRRQRDEFVNAILISTGYKVLHVRAIKTEEIEAFLHN